MLDASIRQAEIAAEQEHVDRVYARLAELRAEAETMRAKGYELAHGAGQEAAFEQAAMLFDRDAMVRYANRLLQALDTEHEGLVFGRLDLADGQALRIGRLGVRDAEHHNLVTDWRAPAAAAFYQATPQEPMDVLRRRVIHCSGETVTDVDDEPLMPEALPEGMPIVGEGALMAALGRARGEAMHNIVATIQREQDEAIRAPAGGVTEITGGPGTGKTAVALHRVAYLLYRERRRLGTGVLVVGPSPVFTSYISRVLPSMGETSAELRSLGELLDGVRATRVDPPAVAAVKGSSRMVRVLRRLVRQTPPDTPTEMRIVYGGEVIRLDARELDRVRRRVHRAGQPNQHRVDAAEALLEALARKAEEYADDTFRPDRAEMIHELGERMEFHRFLVRWWPVLSPTWVLSWLRDRDRLTRAAKGVLSQEEVELLAGAVADGDGWSTADVALLDELRVLLGPPPKRRRRGGAAQWDQGSSDGRPRRPQHYDEYSHIVVDEVQDVSPMQWRMLGRRGRYASWTLVGDPVQTSWPTPEEAEEARDEALGSARTRRSYRLRTNYRNSAEIFAVAASALGDLASAEELPRAVRSTGVEPVVSVVEPDALASATREAAAELLSTVDGTVAVIPAMDRVGEVRSWVDGLGDDRLRVVGSLDAKGLEYDGVVLVEPGDLLAESPTGRRALYVALTRATQRLTVLATDGSWSAR
ncbi:DNA helicase IV [Streptoalloteichus tenebrarius]|uniref:DNA helicase IV n=1 Tax=Streptoalloteichus tenebrarius (strain ATCC 17920 / DSM 40477 / JCM 4838 / CBS 697.72 / NBRC 16177 / NCIMB 11028 / NRRL B-12390 / A12253. 1 / ISP 5477) TaxID=1933 RepID=A0ABT1HQM5_STRSD|nr:ATP-binding domain-containing protein [Streptoalloteichus tenebrarius]MCP2257797.1 DNA helicase IV [Streptoalloteichus tenebrarius]BFE99842.1 AAA family ATPase [Streptoalloteichus tenebrarius]